MIQEKRFFRYGIIFLLMCFLLPSVVSAMTISFSTTSVDNGSSHYLRGESPDKIDILTDIVLEYLPTESPPQDLYLVYWIKYKTNIIKSDYVPILPQSWGTIGNGCTKLTLPSRTRCVQTLEEDLVFSSFSLKTGTYEIGMTLVDDKDHPTITYDTYTTNIEYHVFFGNISFNGIDVEFTDFSLYLSCQGGDYYFTNINGSADIMGNEPWQWSAVSLCTQIKNISNGYIDLGVVSGTANIGDVSGIISEFEISFFSMTMDNGGAEYDTAEFSLPESVSVHRFKGSSPDHVAQICPLGVRLLQFGPGSFASSIDEIVLNDSGEHYFHGYGLPFYIKTGSIIFDMGNSDQGLRLESPEPVYVHDFLTKSGVIGEDDNRSNEGFPSNDILFSKGGFAGAPVYIEPDGINTSNALRFSGGGNEPLFFPRSQIDFNAWDVEVINNQIKGEAANTPDITGVTMKFNRDCPSGSCGAGGGYFTYLLEPISTYMSPQGALYSMSGAMPAPEEESPNITRISWGGFEDSVPTFDRDDGGINTVFVTPGFVIPQLHGIAQTLYGSYTFTNEDKYPQLHILHHGNDDSARLGNGFFAGLNLGPEFLWQEQGTAHPIPGNGDLLNESGDPLLQVRFSGREEQVSMEITPVSKYVLRQAGLTGVFNTTFENFNPSPVVIYDYNLNFNNFAFRQDRNVLDDVTLIDGNLRLHGLVGGSHGMKIDFLSLGLTCNGNLAGGTIDSEDEGTWPNIDPDDPLKLLSASGGDTRDNDEDGLEDEACKLLYYWEMPILLTGISFENNSSDTSSGDCNSEKELELVSRNHVAGVNKPITMSGRYMPDGSIKEQRITSAVEIIVDKPFSGDKPGFSTRLNRAYLNQVSYDPGNIPEPGGFAVLAGDVDVHLFNDAKICFELENNAPISINDFGIYVLHDETISDQDFDGIPDDYEGIQEEENVQEDYWALLHKDAYGEDEHFFPEFKYSWPGPGVIDLNFQAAYNHAVGNENPWFKGFKKYTEIVKIIQLNSNADFITPE